MLSAVRRAFKAWLSPSEVSSPGRNEIISLAFCLSAIAIDWLTPPYVAAAGYYLLAILVAAWRSSRPFLFFITSIAVVSNATQVARTYPENVLWWEEAISWISVILVYGGFSALMLILRIELVKKSRESLTDSLTGISNRRGFFQRLQLEIARSNRSGSSLTVAIIDLDNFKLINDEQGHQKGDEVLIGVAQLVKDGLRRADMVGRIGGDEFGIVMPETPGDDSAIVLERLNGRLHALLGGYDSRAGSSIGAVISERGSKLTSEELLLKADEALYWIKGTGKARVRITRM